MAVVPKFLEKGDVISIVAPAKFVDRVDVEYGIKKLESLWGVKVVVGNYAYGKRFRFSGTDEERLSDLNMMIHDASVKAILMARGGYGCNRIMDGVDYDYLAKHPKWLIGFSDITALICELDKRGIASVHGTMPAFLKRERALDSLETLRKFLFGAQHKIRTQAYVLNKPGAVTSSLIGGNLSILCTMLGTPSFPEVKDRILFIEEIDEYCYKIDRMMVQLKRAGVFQEVSGVVIGYFTGIKDNDDPYGSSAYEIIAEHLHDFKGPVAFNMPIGHEEPNYAIATQIPYTLSVDSFQIPVLEPDLSDS